MIATSEEMALQHDAVRVSREDAIWLSMDTLCDWSSSGELPWRYNCAAMTWRDAPGFVQERFATRLAKRADPIRLIEVWEAWLTREETP
jgi:hypothetical protein